MISIPFTQQTLRNLCLALCVYLTSLFAANTLGLKVMPFLFGGHLSVAFVSFPIVFLTTDVIGEVYGKSIARLFVLAGFVSTGLFLFYSIFSLALPWDASASWVKDGYNTVFGISARIAIASLVAFAIGEYQDVFTFFFFKQKLGDKHFWLRSNLSNLWSQFLDTVIFMLIAFLGVYSWSTLISLIFSWWAYKVLMGILYTPLSYLGIRVLKAAEKKS